MEKKIVVVPDKPKPLKYKDLLKLSDLHEPKKEFKHVDLGNGFVKVVEVKDPN